MEWLQIGIDELIRERDRLQRQLEWLGVRSSGSDMLVDKIHRINVEIAVRGA